MGNQERFCETRFLRNEITIILLLIIILKILFAGFSRLSSDYGESLMGCLLTLPMANVLQVI